MAQVVIQAEEGDSLVFQTDGVMVSPPEGESADKPPFYVELKPDMNILLLVPTLKTNKEFVAYLAEEIAKQVVENRKKALGDVANHLLKKDDK